MATVQANLAKDHAPIFESTYGNTITVHSSYTASAALAAGDVIEMLKVPQGAKVIGGYIRFDALQTGTTVSVGDSGSATRFVSAQAADTVGSADFTGVPHEYSAEETIKVTLGTAGMDAADSIDLVVQYIISD